MSHLVVISIEERNGCHVGTCEGWFRGRVVHASPARVRAVLLEKACASIEFKLGFSEIWVAKGRAETVRAWLREKQIDCAETGEVVDEAGGGFDILKVPPEKFQEAMDLIHEDLMLLASERPEAPPLSR